jgi:hypothetical protein
MTFPEKEFKYVTYESGAWGGLEGSDGETHLYALGHHGPATKQEMYDFGVATSHVPKEAWKDLRLPRDATFAWSEGYIADGDSYSLVALLGKHARSDIHYLMFVVVPHAQFDANKDAYTKWIKSIHGK